MQGQTIDIGTVMARLNDTYDEVSQVEKYFGIRFLDRNGITHEVEARKNVKIPRMKGSSMVRGKAEVNLKRNGIVMLYPKDSDHPITPKVCMIYGFKEYQSNTWLNVFH